MKKLFLLSLTISLFSLLNAQEYEYVPFQTTNAEWSNIDIDYSAPSGYDTMNCIYKLSDIDTLQYGIVCHKLFRLKDTLNGEETASLAGCIGEKDKKIYFDGYLLYDFNIDSVGDTVNVDIPINVPLVISNIDTILLGGKLRKRFHFEYSEEYFWGMCWIEGIGSTNGLLWPGTFPIGDKYKLLCYKENDTLVYYNDLFGTCYPDYPKIYNKITDYSSLHTILNPNPANQYVNITFKKPYTGTIDICTIDGKIVDSYNIESVDNYRIATANLNNGIYLMTFSSNNQELSCNKLL
jgi:hypothetical protein